MNTHVHILPMLGKGILKKTHNIFKLELFKLSVSRMLCFSLGLVSIPDSIDTTQIIWIIIVSVE